MKHRTERTPDPNSIRVGIFLPRDCSSTRPPRRHRANDDWLIHCKAMPTMRPSPPSPRPRPVPPRTTWSIAAQYDPSSLPHDVYFALLRGVRFDLLASCDLHCRFMSSCSKTAGGSDRNSVRSSDTSMESSSFESNRFPSAVTFRSAAISWRKAFQRASYSSSISRWRTTTSSSSVRASVKPRLPS